MVTVLVGKEGEGQIGGLDLDHLNGAGEHHKDR